VEAQRLVFPCLEDFLWKWDQGQKKPADLVLQARCFVNLLLNIHKKLQIWLPFFSHRYGLGSFYQAALKLQGYCTWDDFGNIVDQELCQKEIISLIAWFFFQFFNIENMACLSKK
jgi:hypothetical protein